MPTTLIANILFDNYQIFSDTLFILFLMIASVGAIGLLAKSLAVSIFGAYLVFIRLASTTGDTTLETIMYVVIVAAAVLMGLRAWSFTNDGGQST